MLYIAGVKAKQSFNWVSLYDIQLPRYILLHSLMEIYGFYLFMFCYLKIAVQII